MAWYTLCSSTCPINIRHTLCLCLHMQQADREWLIRALCWTHACCSAEAVTYFPLSLSDNHTQAFTKGQEGKLSKPCLQHMHSTGPSSMWLHSQPACLYKHLIYNISAQPLSLSQCLKSTLLSPGQVGCKKTIYRPIIFFTSQKYKIMYLYLLNIFFRTAFCCVQTVTPTLIKKINICALNGRQTGRRFFKCLFMHFYSNNEAL